MESFIHFIFKIGIQIHKNFPNNLLIEKDIFKIGYQKSFNDYILMVSEEIHKNVIRSLNDKYVNLEVDSGTVKKLNVIHFIVSVVEDQYMKPYLLKLQKNNHSDFSDYSEYTLNCLNLLLDNNIHICSIIIDNLRAQTKGIEYLKENTNVQELKVFK